MVKVNRLMIVLVFAGASMNAMDVLNMDEALNEAVQANNTEAVKVLLQQGATQFSRDALNRALFVAAIKANKDVCELLIRNGAARNVISRTSSDGVSALMRAANEDNAPWATFLIENGADSNVTSESGSTALMYAAFYGHEQVIRAILTTIPLSERERILKAKNAAVLAHNLAYKQGIRMQQKDVRRLITQEFINRLVQDQVQRIEQMIAVKNDYGETAYDEAVRGDRDYHRAVPSPVTQLLDPNNPETRAWLRSELEKNIRIILFSEPKKKESK